MTGAPGGETFSVDKERGRAVDLEIFSFTDRGSHLAFVLRGKAGVELARVEFGQRRLLAGDAIQGVKALCRVAVRATDLVAMGVKVIDVAPINIMCSAALEAQ